MRKLLVSLVVLLAATLSFSGAPPDRLPTLTAPAEARTVMVVTGQPPAASGCTDANPSGNCTGFDICQNFEGTGLDNSETYTATTDVGYDWYRHFNGCSGCAIEMDYSTNPLRGSQSLQMNNGTVGSSMLSYLGGVDSFYIFFRLKLITAPSIDFADLVSVWDSDISQNMTILLTSSRTLYLGCNVDAESSSATSAIDLNTVYYVWAYFAKGTGNNAQSWLRISTTPTMPGSNTISKTDFNMTNQFQLAGFTTSSGSNEYEYHVDQVLIKTSSIGTVCE